MDDKIKFECPYCGKRINAPVKMAGRKAQCPECKRPVRVPAAEDAGIPGAETNGSSHSPQTPPPPVASTANESAPAESAFEPPPLPPPQSAAHEPPPVVTPKTPVRKPQEVPQREAPVPMPSIAEQTSDPGTVVATEKSSVAMTPSLAANYPAFRKWVSDYIPKRFAGRTPDRFYIAPEIPEKMVSAATSEYAHLEDGEQILMLYDNTVWGSAKTGIVLTDRGIYWLGDADAHKAYYEELEDVRFEKKKLFVRVGACDYLLSRPDMVQMPAAKAQTFGEILQEIFNKIRNEFGPPPGADERDESPESLESALVRILRRGPSRQLHIVPDIPEEKLANASAAYAHPKEGEKVLALLDDTVGGSAKAGFCVTERRLVWTHKRDVREISWPELTGLAAAERGFKLLTLAVGGNRHVLNMAQWNKKNIGALALALSRAARQACEEQGRPAAEGIRQLEQIALDCGIQDDKPMPASGAPKPAVAPQPAVESVQSLEDAIVQAYGMGLTSMFVHPDIPEKKLANATASYAKLKPGERVLALYDDTFFGSAKDGFCLTNRRLYWKGMSSGGLIAYSKLPGVQEASREGTKVRITLAEETRVIGLTTWLDEQIGFLLKVLSVAAQLQEQKTEGSGTVSTGVFALQQCAKSVAGTGRGQGPIKEMPTAYTGTVPAELPAEMRRAIQKDVPQVLREYASDKLFVAPGIPAGRIEGARKAYASLQPEEPMLSLFDSSIAQSGTSGFCLTDRRIAWGESGQARSVPYSDIQDVRHGGDTLGLVAAEGDYFIPLGELDRAQVDGVMTALLRISSIVFSEALLFLRVTHAVLVHVGGDIYDAPGVLGLSSESIVWNPMDGKKKGMNLSLHNITGLQISPDQSRLIFREQGTQVELLLAEAASRWVKYIDEAIDACVGTPTAAKAPGASSPAGVPSAPVSVSDMILAAMEPEESGALFVTPEFNEKKLKNAKKTYLHLDENEELLVLFDDTFWGSAKRGFAMTNRRLIWHSGGESTQEIVYEEIRDVCQEGAFVLFILADDEFRGFSMEFLDAELANTMNVLFSRLVDAFRKRQGGIAEQDFRFLRTGLLRLTEVDGKEIEPTNGLLCLTNRVLIWLDEQSNAFGVSLYDVKLCWKILMGQTFSVERHTRKSGLLGSLGLGGRAKFAWKAKGDAKKWVEAIDHAVADLPPAEP